MVIPGLFAIKVRVGSAEIEVSAPEKDFVLDESSRLIEQFILTPIVSNAPNQAADFDLNKEASLVVSSEAKTTKPQNLVEFLKQFNNLQTNLNKMLVLGYWCEIKLGQPYFTVEDIQAKYEEIREAAPAKIKRDLDILRAKGFLMPPKKSDSGSPIYTLSSSGIKEVEAKMPQA